MSQERVLPDWGTIEHLPQPDEGLSFSVEFDVNLGVVLGFGGYVPRVKRI
jgi:hypothetical protein